VQATVASTPPYRITRRALVVSVIVLALSAAGVASLVERAIAGSVARTGTQTTATIESLDLGDGQRHAMVQFSTATGQLASARIAICHHQAYVVGGRIPIVYLARAPGRAWEKGMTPLPDLRGAAVLALLGLVLSAATLVRLSLPRQAAPASMPAVDEFVEAPLSVPKSVDLAEVVVSPRR
jgi:hypothetical protein